VPDVSAVAMPGVLLGAGVAFGFWAKAPKDSNKKPRTEKMTTRLMDDLLNDLPSKITEKMRVAQLARQCTGQGTQPPISTEIFRSRFHPLRTSTASRARS